MKFVCMECEMYLVYQTTEETGAASIGVRFECPRCKRVIAMVTNAGETRLVQAMGVSLGGAMAARGPLSEIEDQMAPGTAAQAGGEGCPFAARLQEEGFWGPRRGDRA